MGDRPVPPRTLPARVAAHLVRYSVDRAAELVCMVRDEGTDAIGAFLDRLDRQALYGLVVALAAMVPDDATVEELLGWVNEAVPDASAA